MASESSENTYQTIRGMDDVLPEKASSVVYHSEAWVELRRRYADWVERHGFRYIETPVVEYTDLYKRTSGETSDIVSKEMYTFNDAGGRSLTLRPEGTAGICRAVAQHGLSASGQNLRFYYVAPMFRAERPQKGRYRQHTQVGLEVFRETDPLVDAEVIAILLGFYRSLGLGQLSLHINSVGSPVCRPAYRDKLVAYLREHEGALSEDSRRRLPINPMRVLDSKEPQDQPIVAGAPKMIDHLDEECATHFAAVRAALDRLGIAYTVNPRLVRGLDYYVKTAFEVMCESLDGSIKVIGGGGRYDGLVEQLGGPPTPGIGYGAGIERILMACDSQGITLAPRRAPLVWVAYVDDAARLDAFAMTQELRAAGLNVDFSHRPRKLGKQLEAAAKAGAAVGVILGGDEATRGECQLKNFADRSQRAVALATVNDELARLLG